MKNIMTLGLLLLSSFFLYSCAGEDPKVVEKSSKEVEKPKNEFKQIFKLEKKELPATLGHFPGVGAFIKDKKMEPVNPLPKIKPILSPKAAQKEPNLLKPFDLKKVEKPLKKVEKPMKKDLPKLIATPQKADPPKTEDKKDSKKKEINEKPSVSKPKIVDALPSTPPNPDPELQSPPIEVENEAEETETSNVATLFNVPDNNNTEVVEEEPPTNVEGEGDVETLDENTDVGDSTEEENVEEVNNEEPEMFEEDNVDSSVLDGLLDPELVPDFSDDSANTSDE